MITAVTIQAKLLTIVILALMNILLLKRKTKKQTIETYTLQDTNTNFNIINHDNNNHNNHKNDKNSNNDHSQLESNKISNSNYQQQHKSLHQESTFFVNLQSQKPQNTSSNLISQKNQQYDQALQQHQNNYTFLSQQQFQRFDLHQNSQAFQNQSLQQQSKENNFQQNVMDQQFPSKDESKPQTNQIKKYPRKYISISSTERKNNHFVESSYPSEFESESDSQTRKIKLNTTPKQHNTKQCDCEIKKVKSPQQTFKRCIQELICNAVEEMVGKDSVELGMATKKKKSSE